MNEVEIQLSRISSTVAERDGKFILRVEDEKSGCRIVEVELDNDAIANLVSTRTAYGKAEVFAEHAPRWGKTLETDMEVLGRFDTDSQARKVGEALREGDGWDTVRVSRQNTGNYVARFRRWV